jgi:hypothetical protein
MSRQQGAGTHARTLAEDGVVVIRDYLDPETCDGIRAIVEGALAEGLPEARAAESYNDLVARGEPVVKRRSGERDDGMLDIFNTGVIAEELAAFKTDEFVADIVNGATDEPYSADNVNVYVNRSVANTRDYHADTYAGKFKSFVYLTDVPNPSYGPFAYLKGSHEKSTLERKASKLVNRVRDDPATNAVRYNGENELVCTAPKGTLIIADQAGFHRGIPQEEGKHRMLATTSYTPE